MGTDSGLKLVPPGEGPTLAVAGGRYTIKASGEDTGGAFTLIEMLVPPQAGAIPHLHEREEESFYILEGSLRFRVGDETLTAAAGTFVKTPRGVCHGFQNVGETPARVLLLVVPAGLEKFFQEVGQFPSEKSSPPNVEKFKEVAPRYGLTILGSG